MPIALSSQWLSICQFFCFLLSLPVYSLLPLENIPKSITFVEMGLF